MKEVIPGADGDSNVYPVPDAAADNRKIIDWDSVRIGFAAVRMLINTEMTVFFAVRKGLY